ncbi:hypothetical protein CDL12_14962 [Handroanthus impetiginosus]|uniref:Uncharacterized protein n=1 Tax=Handroanthus impetiginosus TaxID=429701 RepID=A0A2G9H4I7_9LAMI|nr:hypothetical protein CDL12_14962 [Handroanthus impetiginosus]
MKHNIWRCFGLSKVVSQGTRSCLIFLDMVPQQRNYIVDEADGFDETLCPLDFETQGMIVDNEINATIVRSLPPGVKLHAIIDACHRSGRYAWEDHHPRTGAWKGTSGGEVISKPLLIQLLYLSPKVTSTGAMPFAFIQAVERGHTTIYRSMLNAMRSTIRKTDNDIGGGGVVVMTLLTMLLTGGSGGMGLTQTPQLTANEPFDAYSKPFSL